MHACMHVWMDVSIIIMNNKNTRKQNKHMINILIYLFYVLGCVYFDYSHISTQQ